jgi:hypothetical protein
MGDGLLPIICNMYTIVIKIFVQWFGNLWVPRKKLSDFSEPPNLAFRWRDAQEKKKKVFPCGIENSCKCSAAILMLVILVPPALCGYSSDITFIRFLYHRV